MKPELIEYTDAPVKKRLLWGDWEPLVQLVLPPDDVYRAYDRVSESALTFGIGERRQRFVEQIMRRNKLIATWAHKVFATSDWNARVPWMRCIGGFGSTPTRLYAPKCKAVLRYRWPA